MSTIACAYRQHVLNAVSCVIDVRVTKCIFLRVPSKSSARTPAKTSTAIIAYLCANRLKRPLNLSHT